jgi:hypothetical protein
VLPKAITINALREGEAVTLFYPRNLVDQSVIDTAIKVA